MDVLFWQVLYLYCKFLRFYVFSIVFLLTDCSEEVNFPDDIEEEHCDIAGEWSESYNVPI